MSDVAYKVIVGNGMDDILFKTIMLKGADGNSISSIEKTSTSGLVDTYTIYLTDGTVGGTFTVTNGTLSSFDDHLDSSSTNAVQNKVVKSAIDDLDERVDALEAVPIDESMSPSSTHAVQNKVIKEYVDSLEADAIAYDNSVSGLVAVDVQNAIDEVFESIPETDSTLDASSSNPLSNFGVSSALQSLYSEIHEEIQDVASDIPDVDTELDASSGNPVANSAVTNAIPTVDNSLNASSGNPVANSAVTAGLNAKADASDLPTGFMDYNWGNVNVPSSTDWQQMASFDLTAGMYFICVACNFQSNATGRRGLGLYTSTGTPSAPNSNLLQFRTQAVAGAGTNIVFGALVPVATDRTIYVLGMQNSGSTITGAPRARYFKLPSIPVTA